MTQISKRYLAPDVQERMFEILIKAVGNASYKGDVVNFLTDLLSYTERIMLAKRLAIAYLLIKGDWTHREISKILKVSLTTIQRVSLTINIQGNGYKKIVHSLMKEEKIEKFMEKLGEILTGIPPGGRDWSQWRREREAAKRARRKAF